MNTIEDKNKIARVWCPTTDQGTWIAIHPETGEEFITGNSFGVNLNQVDSSKEFRELFVAPEMVTIEEY